MRAELVEAAHDPDLAAITDFDRLIAAIDNWPEATSLDDDATFNCSMAIPRAIMTVRYMKFITGRNS